MLTYLKAVRMKTGLTQKEVAKRLGISYQYLSDMERNKEPIQQKYLIELAKLYNCHPLILSQGKIEIGGS